MVAGDLVNTASRIQSLAEPGTVFVGEATRRATEPTIAYEDAGTFELKGKDGLTPLWRALRVVSGARGSLKSARPRGAVRRPRPRAAPDQGPLPRLRRGRQGRTSSRSPGSPGSASRGSAWEFYKYFDGLAAAHVLAPRPLPRLRRGRHLLGARGHGADALPDRRGRGAGGRRSRSCARRVEEHIPDAEERRVRRAAARAAARRSASNEPRERQDLFAAWRLFFERLADVYPTVLAFEDMQWADASLLDFVEYLLEWSRNSPLYVITLARPELLERRPTWGAGQRNFSSLYLEPLSPEAMEELLARARARAAGRAARADPRARRGCAALRGRDGADAARPRAARAGRAGLPARSARSSRSRCPRRCTR